MTVFWLTVESNFAVVPSAGHSLVELCTDQVIIFNRIRYVGFNSNITSMAILITNNGQ